MPQHIMRSLYPVYIFDSWHFHFSLTFLSLPLSLSRSYQVAACLLLWGCKNLPRNFLHYHLERPIFHSWTYLSKWGKKLNSASVARCILYSFYSLLSCVPWISPESSVFLHIYLLFPLSFSPALSLILTFLSCHHVTVTLFCVPEWKHDPRGPWTYQVEWVRRTTVPL